MSDFDQRQLSDGARRPFNEISFQPRKSSLQCESALAIEAYPRWASEIDRIGQAVFGKYKIDRETYEAYIHSPPGWNDPSKATPAFFSLLRQGSSLRGFAFSLHATSYELDFKYCYEVGDCYLAMIAIDPKYQGRGLVHSLLSEQEEQAIKLGFSQFTMHATIASGFASKVVARYGDRITDEHYYQDPYFGPQHFLRVKLIENSLTS
ncbi:MAG: hypothetical protein KDD62_06350 [Bdellovibrionales bacterium]|nr:hypothetical protein [Bdellovibrionales bacterium]